MKVNERRDIMIQPKITVNENCVGCGLCINDCPAHNITLNNFKAQIVAQDCIMCGHCEAICPKEAVSISGYEENTIEKKNISKIEPNDLLNQIRFGRTIRQFQNKDIPKTIIDQILETGRLTHTSKNDQDVSFIILDSKKSEIESMAVCRLRKIKPLVNLFSSLARRNKISDHFFFFQAPKVIIVCSHNQVNGILAAQNMKLMAEANGLGVLFSGYFTTMINLSYKIKKALKIPYGKKAVATLVLGYPQINYLRSPKRKKLDATYL